MIDNDIVLRVENRDSLPLSLLFRSIFSGDSMMIKETLEEQLVQHEAYAIFYNGAIERTVYLI